MSHHIDLTDLEAAPVNGAALVAARAAYAAEVAANGQTLAAVQLARAVYNKIGQCCEELNLSSAAIIERCKNL